MKTLLIANRKGGVGKSAIACQLAHYLTDKRGQRVLVIDLDNQRNTSKILQKNEGVATSRQTGSALYADDIDPEIAPFLVIGADQELAKLEKAGASEHNRMASQFARNIQRYSDHYDVCIIDTSPAADIRVTSALVAATHTLAPIQFLQESIDGVGPWLHHVQLVKDKLNPELQVIGLLPSMVEAVPLQQRNAKAIFEAFAKYLIRLPDGSFGQVKKSSAMSQAQEEGLPVWKLPTTTGRELWRAIEPTFAHIAEQLI